MFCEHCPSVPSVGCAVCGRPGRELTDAEYEAEVAASRARVSSQFRAALDRRRAGQVERNRAAFARDLADRKAVRS